MNYEQILMYVVALILGMLLANMLKGVCGCKVVEGAGNSCNCVDPPEELIKRGELECLEICNPGS